MTTYVYRDGKLVEKQDASRSRGIEIVSDIHSYLSPCTDSDGKHPFISSRSARREDLKRNHCVEVDPGQFRSIRDKRTT